MARRTRLDHAGWNYRATLVEEFVRRNQRLPRPADGPVGAWLSGQRSELHLGKASMTVERQAFLDKIAPGWRNFLLSLTPSWSERAEHLMQFRASERRWPSQTAIDEDERSLGKWLSLQRSVAHRGELSDKRCAALDQYLPGWDPGSREQAWYQNADDLAAFVHKHGRRPSKNGAETERQLGSWLHNRRHDARVGTGWTPERAAYLDRVVPGWNE